MRNLIQIVENAAEDVEYARQAQHAAITVSHAIYNNPRPDKWLDVGKYGEFFLYTPHDLGLIKDFPWMSNVAILLGKKLGGKVNGNSGAVFNMNPPMLDQFHKGVVLQGMTDMSEKSAASFANSTEFLDIFSHEFIHLLDGRRTNDAILTQRYEEKGDDETLDASAKKDAYYNDPAELNAYYHDVVSSLTYIINSAANGESVQDYLDLYGMTGDFKTDLSRLLGNSRFTRDFIKWLRAPNRKKLLRRIFKLYAHLQEIQKNSPQEG